MSLRSSGLGQRAQRELRSNRLPAIVALSFGGAMAFAGCTTVSRNQNAGAGDAGADAGGAAGSGGTAGQGSTAAGTGGQGGTATGGASGGSGVGTAGATGESGADGSDGNTIGRAIPDGPCASATGNEAGAGGADSQQELCAFATALAGLRWELPCTSRVAGDQGNCSSPVVNTKSATLVGAPGAAYDITMRFRGVVEQKTYYSTTAGVSSDAAQGPLNANFFNVGGSPDPTAFNQYQLDVSDPKQIFFLNSGLKEDYFVYPIDYVATIRVNAGATVTLTADSVEGLENPNRGTSGNPVIVPGVAPAPDPYNGQFAQMDVESVVRAR